MMRLQTYASFSLLAAIAVIYHAFSSKEQLYPAMVYLSTSKICLVILLNMGFVIMCIMWQLVKRIFLGSLREAEVERLNEQSWREVMEILFAITIFRQEFSVGFLGMVTALLLIKALHWLAQKRVEYIETTPTVTLLSHIRIVSFMGFLLILDSIFLYSSMKSLIETWQASVALFFSFEYMILAMTTLSAIVKYVFYVTDMLREGQWERKAVYTFYLELIHDLLHLSMYLVFFLVIFMNYGVPLHLIRELYETFRNFKIRIADYIRYRNITSNMNERFPDATPEELSASDATCIICREEMVTAKKLRCGHLFHVQCLRSWLERQHTCPTCRSLVVPPDDRSTSTGRQPGMPAERPQTAEVSSQDALVGTTNNFSEHEIRLQAASAAAAVYQKSMVNPPANTFIWSPGYVMLPQANIPATVVYSGSRGELAQKLPVIGQSHQQQPLLPVVYSDLATHLVSTLQLQPNVKDSPLEAREILIQQQIEALQNQLQLLQQKRIADSEPAKSDHVTSEADIKGKAVASTTSDSTSSDCGRHGDHNDD